MPDMTDAQRREYAETIILEHAQEVEYLSIFEMADQFSPTGECTDADARAVSELITRATVTVTW